MKTKIYENTVVYIAAPANFASGGPELLHQLASHLRKRGVDARMWYIPSDAADPVEECYRRYHIPFVRNPADRAENVLIVPETMTEEFFRYPNMRCILWWLSVDTWMKAICQALLNSIMAGPGNAKLPKFFYFQSDLPVVHWAQSEYARRFLERNGVPAERIHFVGDYLNPVFLRNARDISADGREDIIVFNPAKGLAFTRKLEQAAPDLQWRPIQGMVSDEVRQLLGKAKIYVDFGDHPGRDRIPREAAVQGCCVITSKRGSAANEIDVPIPEEYKFEDEDGNIPAIVQKIRFVLEHYSSEKEKFASYRERILEEPGRFGEDVDLALQYSTSMRARIALLQVSENAGDAIWKEIRQMPGFQIEFAVDCISGRTGHDEALGVTFVDVQDAEFLCMEGRIQKFMVVGPFPSDEIRDRAMRMLDALCIRGEDRLIAEWGA